MHTRLLLTAFLITAVTVLGIHNGTGSHEAHAADTSLPADYWPEPMTVYPGVSVMPLSSDMNLGRDNQVRMAWFTTEDEPLAVVKFYENHWNQAGYFVSRDVTPYGGRVSAVDPRTGVLRQITLSKEGGKTTVFMSMALSAPHDLDKTPEDIPVYPGAESVISFTSNDALTSSDVVTFMDAGTAEDNASFYKNKLAELGYSLTKETTNNGVHMLVFSRAKEEITISVIWEASMKMSKVHVARIKGKGE